MRLTPVADGMRKVDMRQATDFIRAVVRDPAAFPGSFISLPMDPDLIATVLSRERIRLVQLLQIRGPIDTVHGLADALHRNYASVSRDLGFLVGMGLVVTEKRGRRKAIQATGRPILIMNAEPTRRAGNRRSA
jgi:predicted transcriptional regulator